VIDDYISAFLLLLTGFGGGIYVGISSGTAIVFMIPCMTIFIGSNIYQAIGTSLIIDCIIGGVAGLIFLKKGKVDFIPVIILCLAGMIGSFIGTFYNSNTPESFLTILIVIVLIFIGVNLIKNGVKKNVEYINNKLNFTWFKNNKIISFIFFGLIIGFSSGFSGMGSSAAVTLVLIFIMGYDLHTSIGTALLMMFFIAGSAAIGHGIIYENIVYNAALIAGLGAIIGATSGSLIANRINEDKLGRLIGFIILILGVLIIIKILF
jgi:uncharacterized membrane protein YfcA